jgi:carboxypeptidase C (cathepsin A)
LAHHYFRTAAFVILSVCVVAQLALAEDSQPSGDSGVANASHDNTNNRTARDNGTKDRQGDNRLPKDALTHQSVTLADGRVLNFTATAGSMRLRDEKGQDEAVIGFVAYQLEGGKAQTRPVTFAFNGGPGAGSAWLDIGAIGPWRLPMEPGQMYPSAPPVLIDNHETWLDFTDLVFIDPPGTGYSRILADGDAAKRKFWSVSGDVKALSEVVRRWLARNNRTESPKFIVGESYGGFRGPLLAQELATNQGVGISGLVLISPVLDFDADTGPFYWLDRLPAYAAAYREEKGPVSRADLADIEHYATGDYLQDFMRGPRDIDAVSRMVQNVTQFTGLDPALVKRLGGRIDRTTFQREHERSEGKVVGAYDSTVSAYDPDPTSNYNEWQDPAVTGFEAPMTSAIVGLYNDRLNWTIDRPYNILSQQVSRGWTWGNQPEPPSATEQLRGMLALDPKFRVLVSDGLTDIQVPYLENKRVLDQVPDYGAPGRLQFKVYPGGHMFYSRDDSRKMLHADAETVLTGQ